MNDGGGCAGCPVRPCETLTYRGSACMAQRAKLGLGDPWTQSDRIRVMSDEELAKFLENASIAGCPDPARSCRASCTDCILDWLRQPVKEA